ncbi:hypothetical protein ATY81_16880 [Rhizobium sp. R72]|nr:hypothetical protein ATY81_16880 [Rhizobium sp. R72]OWV93032.1 hypothetical protein ATY80_16880 [Rhizobium sp. R711]
MLAKYRAAIWRWLIVRLCGWHHALPVRLDPGLHSGRRFSGHGFGIDPAPATSSLISSAAMHRSSIPSLSSRPFTRSVWGKVADF